MGESQLDRIRGDLETIREAAGLGLPFGWEDVWISLALVPCGVILAVVGTFAPLRLDPAWGGLGLRVGPGDGHRIAGSVSAQHGAITDPAPGLHAGSHHGPARRVAGGVSSPVGEGSWAVATGGVRRRQLLHRSDDDRSGAGESAPACLSRRGAAVALRPRPPVLLPAAGCHGLVGPSGTRRAADGLDPGGATALRRGGP